MISKWKAKPPWKGAPVSRPIYRLDLFGDWAYGDSIVHCVYRMIRGKMRHLKEKLFEQEDEARPQVSQKEDFSGE